MYLFFWNGWRRWTRIPFGTALHYELTQDGKSCQRVSFRSCFSFLSWWSLTISWSLLALCELSETISHESAAPVCRSLSISRMQNYRHSIVWTCTSISKIALSALNKNSDDLKITLKFGSVRHESIFVERSSLIFVLAWMLKINVCCDNEAEMSNILKQLPLSLKYTWANADWWVAYSMELE